MNFLSPIVRQTAQLVGSLPAGRQFMLLAILVGSVAGLGWLMVRASTGGYVPVLTQAEPGQTGTALTALMQLGIPARAADNGATLLVARNRQDEAQMALATAGIYGRGSVGAELLDRTTFGDSQFKQEANYLRVREGELARTLNSLTEVAAARVHLALPDKGPFVSDAQAPKASVILKLRPGARLNDRQIAGIVNLVSHGIEGLEAENVSVIDADGNMLSQQGSSALANASGENLTFKSQAEERLRAQIEKLLEPSIGRGKVVANVQMDYDFASLKKVETIYNPTEQDPITQTEKTTVERQNAPSPTGDPSGVTTGAGGMQRDDTSKSYAISTAVQETAQTAPALKRVAVGVVMDGVYDETTAADGKVERVYRTRTPEEMAGYERIVKAAIGFDSEVRGDLVELSCVPFQIDAEGVGEQAWLTPELRRLTEMGLQWAMVGLIAVLLIFMVLKPAVAQISMTQVTRAGALPAGAAGAIGRVGENLPGLAGEGPGRSGAFQRDNRLAQLHESNKMTSESSDRIFEEIQAEAQENPQRTVSMIRQWMEEG